MIYMAIIYLNVRVRSSIKLILRLITIIMKFVVKVGVLLQQVSY